jgi:hypothetical protein
MMPNHNSKGQVCTRHETPRYPTCRGANHVDSWDGIKCQQAIDHAHLWKLDGRAKPNFPARVTVVGVDKETRLGLSGVTTTGTNEEAEVTIVAAMPEEEMPLASTVD